MTRKLLLTGKTGQVGSELAALLPKLGEVTALDRQQLDLADPRQIRDVIRSVSPDIIVNAAAYTAVDRAESEADVAESINAVAPKILAEEAQRLRALLVHYSTDYVFDGTKGAPYTEEDVPDPQSVYGRTKLLGERAVQQAGAAHLIFRTAWVYGREGRNFLLTILRLATERNELKIVSDQLGAPTWSKAIASATVEVLSKLCPTESGFDLNSHNFGIYHLTAAGETSWFGFAKAIMERVSEHPPASAWFEAATKQRPILAQRVLPIRTNEYPTPARRPAYSVLSNDRLARVFGIRLPDWQSQLRSCFADGAAVSPSDRQR